MSNLNIIFDCSGSFCIRGKKKLLPYAFHMLKSLKQTQSLSEVCFFYFFWQEDELSELEDEDILLQPDGSSDYNILVDFLIDKTEQGEPCILMTDGCSDSWDILSQLPQSNKSLVSLVLMGADADWQMAETCDICLYSLSDLPTAVMDIMT